LKGWFKTEEIHVKTVLGMAAALVLLGAANPARAGVVFDNYPLNGTIDAFEIGGGGGVSDSFTLISGAAVNGVNFAVWNEPGDQVSTIDWSIGSAPFGNDFGGGTASVTNNFDFTNGFGFDINSDSISFGDIALAPGTYYITLTNGVATNNDAFYWDENDGVGTPDGAGILAFDNDLGPLSGTNCGGVGSGNNGNCAQSFQITADTVPEPGTLGMLGAGLLLAAGGWRRKAARK
jgi:PEP-CTERM motif